LAAVVVLTAALFWVVIPFIQELFKYEQLTFHDYWWTRNSGGNISMVTLHLQNNGTKTLTISDVFVNQTHVEPTRWDSTNEILPSEFWSWMYIAPQGMVFEEDSAYNLTVGTEAGNSFSYVVKVEEDDVSQEEFNIKYVSFNDWRYYGDPLFADICVENHHNYVVVTERRINGTPFGTEKYWIRPTTEEEGGLCISFIFNWTGGTTYTFTLRTACGNTYNYTKTAP
jgi:hypothetical protein